jgi:hypothetical protein
VSFEFGNYTSLVEGKSRAVCEEATSTKIEIAIVFILAILAILRALLRRRAGQFVNRQIQMELRW